MQEDGRTKLSAPTASPTWLRVLSFLMLMVAAQLGLQGLTSLVTDPARPSSETVVLSTLEAHVRVAQLAAAISHVQHPEIVRAHAGAQILVAVLLLLAVAAIFTRDVNGRRLALVAGSASLVYQVLHAVFAILIERPALLTAVPQFLEDMGRPSEIAETLKTWRNQTVVSPIVFLLVGLLWSGIVLVFFAGRRGRILYGLERPSAQGS